MKGTYLNEQPEIKLSFEASVELPASYQRQAYTQVKTADDLNFEITTPESLPEDEHYGAE
jgi:hypothetical protein